jgi:PIN domain nuclease of toxin-antitoxin system
LIALDTHALVWYAAEPKKIPAKARRLIETAIGSSEHIAISSISVWEIAMLVARGRLELTIDAETWMARVQELPFLTFHPVDNAVALRAVRLTDFPRRDPADRMIVATALGLNATLVTADKRLRAYRPLQTVWD